MVVDRSGYISAGKFLVDLLKSTNDPRLEMYFSSSNGQVTGAPPGGGSRPVRRGSATRWVAWGIGNGERGDVPAPDRVKPVPVVWAHS